MTTTKFGSAYATPGTRLRSRLTAKARPSSAPDIVTTNVFFMSGRRPRTPRSPRAPRADSAATKSVSAAKATITSSDGIFTAPPSSKTGCRATPASRARAVADRLGAFSSVFAAASAPSRYRTKPVSRSAPRSLRRSRRQLAPATAGGSGASARTATRSGLASSTTRRPSKKYEYGDSWACPAACWTTSAATAGRRAKVVTLRRRKRWIFITSPPLRIHVIPDHRPARGSGIRLQLACRAPRPVAPVFSRRKYRPAGVPATMRCRSVGSSGVAPRSAALGPDDTYLVGRHSASSDGAWTRGA